jgi:hypothetical protein
MRLTVRARARLRGMGLESHCEVVAIKTSRSESGVTHYSHCHVLVAPSDWPDGEYTVNLDGHYLLARRQLGLWLAPDESEPAYMPTSYSAAD